MTKHLFSTALLGLALCLMSGQAASTMTDKEVARLGDDLTPVGAERAGNAEGTIPEWTGGLTQAPQGFDRKNGYIDPFADEKPKFTITASNMAKYEDHLTEGQKAMLRRFPESYQIPVYPTHRTAALPQAQYDLIKTESKNVELAGNGEGLLNFDQTSVPFPIPDNALEILWNHLTRYRAGGFLSFPTESVVQSNGAFTPIVRERRVTVASAMENPKDNRLFYLWDKTIEPASVAGSQLLVHEPINHIKEQRQAWRYNPGQRRVLRAPEVGYDSPGLTSDGLRTIDSTDMFSGAPDKYNWTLVGKKEVYIPYNSYKLADHSLKYTDIIQAKHINQALTRYELHPVWVIEANLKKGERHLYAKRRFYIDQDSWAIVASDLYDGRGDLWRTEEAHQIHYYDVLVQASCAQVTYDLQSARYLIVGLQNEEPVIEFGPQGEASFYSPAMLRRRGR